jgi:hypothetical protein
MNMTINIPRILIQALLPLVLMLAFNASASESDFAKPETACALLSEHRLRTSGWSKRVGGQQFECRSHYREFLTSGRLKNRIRYIAYGSADLVNMLRLELQIRARRDVQRAHKHLLDYTTLLVNQTLGADLPEDMQEAILSGIKGNWRIKTAVVRLERFTLENVHYELHLTIDLGSKS